MTRWLFILLAVIVGWFPPTAAHAHARVAQAYDAGAPVAKVVLVAGITMDTHEGNNEDPLSLHKYLYCQANPIDGIDPSGHDDMITTLGNMALQAYVRTSLFIAERPIMARVAGLVIGATFMSALDIDPDSLQGIPGFQGLGAFEAGEVKLLAAIKRGPVYDALTASLKGMLSHDSGHLFQKFLRNNVFKGIINENVKMIDGRDFSADFELENAFIEAKHTMRINNKQLEAIAQGAKNRGKEFWYVFLQKPGNAVMKRIEEAGGKVAWFLDGSDD